MAVAVGVRMGVEARPDRVIRATSAQLDAERWRESTLGDLDRTGTWFDHVRGAVSMLVPLGLQRGFDARITSDIPMGAGLGSSGALGVALLRALREAFAIEIDDVALARLAQRAENEFAGARSGIMDQLAASVGHEGEALFIDCRSLAFQRIPLPAEPQPVVVASAVRHEHVSGAYNQ